MLESAREALKRCPVAPIIEIEASPSGADAARDDADLDLTEGHLAAVKAIKSLK